MYSEYEVQRKAKIALAKRRMLGLAGASEDCCEGPGCEKESAPQVCPREPALFCGPFDRLRVCLGAQVAA